MSKHNRRICRCTLNFESLEGRGLLSQFASTVMPDLARSGVSQAGSPAALQMMADPSPGQFGGDQAAGLRISGDWGGSFGNGNGNGYGGFNYNPPAARSTSAASSTSPSETSIQVVDTSSTHTSGVSTTTQTTTQTTSAASSAQVARGVGLVATESTTGSISGAALAVLPSGTQATAILASTASGEDQAIALTTLEVPISAQSINDASVSRPVGSPIGIAPVAPIVPIQGTPDLELPITLAFGKIALPRITSGLSSANLPSPLGADLIAEMVPVDGNTIDESLASLFGRLGRLGDPAGEQTSSSYFVYPVIFAAAAFEAVRRWRKRRTTVGPNPPRNPRGFTPNGLP